MWGYGPGSMMGYGGAGGGMLFGGILWILVLALAVFAVIWVVRSSTHTMHHGTGTTMRADNRSASLNILEERYARGEIDRDEYLRKRDDLRRKR